MWSSAAAVLTTFVCVCSFIWILFLSLLLLEYGLLVLLGTPTWSLVGPSVISTNYWTADARARVRAGNQQRKHADALERRRTQAHRCANDAHGSAAAEAAAEATMWR